jgi:asparagine synthase (glutamine-hydrolysing)
MLTTDDIDGWAHPLRRVMINAVERRYLPLYLRVEDRNSMANSVEARLPFLDYRLVSLAFSLAGEWKFRDGWNKYLVREALRGIIAEPVRTRRDKMGFPTPNKGWWGGPWYGRMMDTLSTQRLRECGAVDIGLLRSTLEQHKKGYVDASRDLFRVAQFAEWLTTCSGTPMDARLSDASPVGASMAHGSTPGRSPAR